MAYVLPMLIAVACAVAVWRWRWGVAAAILIGLVQDPLRKLTPGTPGLYAMSSVPVWLSALAGAWMEGATRVRAFLARFPRVGQAMIIFAAYLPLPAALSAGYGRNTIAITALGALIYGSMFLMLCSGWRYALRPADTSRLLAFYARATAVMLIGGPLNYLGWNERFAAIGTEALGHIWVTHRTGEAVYMLAGFFRSPDVMGWHAATVFMIAIVLAIRARGSARLAWIGLAVWGALNVWLCGRRKMVSMLPVFLVVYLALGFRFHGIRRWAFSAAMAALAVFIGWHVVTTYIRADAVERFYLTTLREADDSLRGHAVDSVWETIRQAGFWGYGLGMGQQGIHHIKAEMPRLWQESGPSKLVAELGVPGAVLFLWLLVRLGLTAYHVVGRAAGSALFAETAGIFAILAANLVAGLVSAQIFGDPFIALLMALMLGILLSAADLSKGARPEAP